MAWTIQSVLSEGRAELPDDMVSSHLAEAFKENTLWTSGGLLPYTMFEIQPIRSCT